MFHPLSRKTLTIAILLALAIIAVAALLIMLSHQRPTVFGWPAEMTTVAGDGIKGHADGTAGNARFSDPFALAIDSYGVVYVADAGGSNRIRKIGPDGSVTTLPGQFETPSGLAIDRDGNVIVADTGANAIRRISPEGQVMLLAGNGTAGFRDGPASQAQFNGPMGVAVDRNGTIYVADTYNDRIRRIGADGQVTTLAGGAAPGFADGKGDAAAFDTPGGIAIDRDDALVIADTGNDAIRRIGKDGIVSTLAHTTVEDRAGLLKAPIGLAPTWDGFLYIASYHRGRIVQMSPKGELRALAGRDAAIPGNAALRFASPAGLAIDRSGALYVADTSRYAIRKLSPRRGGAAPSAELRFDPPPLVHATSFPWPVAPQQSWHEVVGDMGEVRGNYQGEPRDHIHAGLDIHADIGQPVLAVADETVSDPLPNFSLDGLSEGMRIDAMTYIHMRVGRTQAGTPLDPSRFQLVQGPAGHLTAVRIKRGTRFRVGDPLGTVNRMAHVHLELGVPGGQINPIVLPLPGFTDHVAPRIDGVHISDGAGQRLTKGVDGRIAVAAHGGTLDIVVDAWDQVDQNEPRRRLGLYRAGFQILRADGTPMPGYERPRISLLFDRVPRDADAARIAYAADSGDAVHSDQPTRFLYVVTNRVTGGRAERGGWNPSGLKPGNYVIRIFAADFAGNQAAANRDLPITVR